MKRFWMMAAVAGLAAAGCSRGPGIQMDEPMRVASESGQAELASGNYAGASAEFEQALARAYVLGDRRAAAAYRYRIASCRLGQGRLEEAAQEFADAAVEAAAAQDRMLEARCAGAEARVLLAQGDGVKAGDRAARGLAVLKEGGVKPEEAATLSADLHLVLAEVAALLGGERLAEARRERAEARAVLGKRKPEAFFEATSARVLGRILEKEANVAAEAATSYDQESQRWQQAGRFSERAAALERAAGQWRKAGKPEWAAERLLEAARIRFGLGQGAEVRALAAQAGELADLAKRPDLKAQAAILAKPR